MRLNKHTDSVTKRMLFFLRTTVAIALLLPTAAMVRAVEGTNAYYIQLLEKHGIQPSADSLSNYLDSLHPNAETREKVEQLVRQLGDDDFAVREDATRKLLRMPIASRTTLVDAATGGDPEIRWRARSILEQASKQSEQIYYAIAFLVKDHKIPGLIGHILSAIPYFDKPHLQHVAHRALKSIATEKDVPTLRAGLSSKSYAVRIAAIVTIESVALKNELGNDTKNLIKSLLPDQDQRVRLAAARAIANFGDRNCFAVLLDLIESDDVAIRSQSISILHGVTRKRFGFIAYDDPKKRKLSIARWRAWVEGEGRTAKLHYPLDETPPFRGHVLVCNYSGNLVTEYDGNGNEIWKKEKLDQPWGVQVLPNNHRLVAACTGKYVVEFDANGNEVWRKKDLPSHPLSVQRLDNGNTLVATASANKVIEIAPNGEIAWELNLVGFMADADRLPNGLTLVTNYSRGEVAEVDRKGEIVWRIGGFKNPRSAQRLDNGNTLVCDHGHNRVVECDRDGKVVWKYADLATTYDCQRLPDGRTLIGDSSGLRLVEQDGKTIWHRKLPSTGRIFAY